MGYQPSAASARACLHLCISFALLISPNPFRHPRTSYMQCRCQTIDGSLKQPAGKSVGAAHSRIATAGTVFEADDNGGGIADVFVVPQDSLVSLADAIEWQLPGEGKSSSYFDKKKESQEKTIKTSRLPCHFPYWVQ